MICAFAYVYLLPTSTALKLIVKSQQEECVSHTIDLEQSQVCNLLLPTL